MTAAAELAADTSVPLDDRSIGVVLREQAAARGDAPALYWLASDGSLGSLSYQRLCRAAATLAAEWQAQLTPGARVAVWSPNAPEWVILEYAAALSGAILTPINPALTEPELRRIVEQSGAELLYAATSFRGRALLERARAVTSDLPVEVRNMQHLPTAVGGDDLPEKLPALDEVESSAPFLLQYTSGTTGSPKGAVLSHSAAYNAGRFSAARLGLTETDVWLCPLPLHHVGGSVCILLPMLSAGGAVALAAGWDVERVVQLVAASGSTVLGAVPTMMVDLAQHPAARDGRLSSLRILQGGGSTVAPALIERLESALGASVVVAYGQSEAPVTISCSLEDSAQDKAQTIGRPLPHREVRIADPETGTTLGIDEVGELLVRSPLSMTGYWRDPAATAAAIDSDGWLHSGDLCSLDARGVIRIHGRRRDLIIRGGENIFPADVEEALLAHPNVSDVAVVGAPSDRFGEEPVAFIIPVPGKAAIAAELDVWAHERLAGFACPRHYYVVDRLPLTASGKVQKFVLRERLKNESQEGPSYQVD